MFFFFQLAQILPDERVFCRAAPSGTPDCYVDEEGNLDEVIDNLYIDQDFPE